MKDLVYGYMAFGEDYWWEFFLVWLLLIIAVRFFRFANFRNMDLIIPGALFLLWYILEILRYVCLI